MRRLVSQFLYPNTIANDRSAMAAGRKDDVVSSARFLVSVTLGFEKPQSQYYE